MPVIYSHLVADRHSVGKRVNGWPLEGEYTSIRAYEHTSKRANEQTNERANEQTSKRVITKGKYTSNE
jgi:hypothetical protein